MPIATRREPLHALLHLIEQAKSPTMLASHWRAHVGDELLALLVRAGVLVEREPMPLYPCGGPCGDGCPRRVVPNVGSASHPFVAVCGRDDTACVEVLLRAEDCRVLALSLDGFVRWIRRVLGIEGGIEREDAGFPHARRIGERGGRAVFLALAPSLPGFEAWLASRGDALVVAPCGHALATATRDRFGAGQRVQLIMLRELLRLEAGDVRGALPKDDAATATAVAPRPSRVATCVVVDHHGRRELTVDEYRTLVERVTVLDLFIDTTVTVDGGGHRGIRRDERGVVEEAALTKHEAAVLVTLIGARRALRAHDFSSVGVNAVDKVIERARAKVDVRQGRYKWRAFHTLAGDTPEAKRWQFNPPASLRFCAIAPPPCLA